MPPDDWAGFSCELYDDDTRYPVAPWATEDGDLEEQGASGFVLFFVGLHGDLGFTPTTQQRRGEEEEERSRGRANMPTVKCTKENRNETHLSRETKLRGAGKKGNRNKMRNPRQEKSTRKYEGLSR